MTTPKPLHHHSSLRELFLFLLCNFHVAVLHITDFIYNTCTFRIILSCTKIELIYSDLGIVFKPVISELKIPLKPQSLKVNEQNDLSLVITQ